MSEELIKIQEPLLKWYDQNKRTLPWRDCNNAYYTWVSEIMLQQTRVEAVKPYFERFMKELPDIYALSKCPEKKLMKLWEGLGYYNRVRNMQKAALQIMEKYNGSLPRDYEQLKELSGIGEYTAGAIASIAYGIPVPAVDGNVLRVISRIQENTEDIMKQSVRNKMQKELLNTMTKERPGDYNQALMELGATVCIPNGEAKCDTCPVGHLCMAKAHDTVGELPVKTAKKPRRIENRTVFVIRDGEKTAIKKRPKSGLLAGLYELPNVEGHLSQEEAVKYAEKLGTTPLRIESLGEAKHIFSHIEWRMTGYMIRVEALEKSRVKNMLFVEEKQARKQYAIPAAFDAYAKQLKEKIK